jgi:hypothetical protein
MYQNNKKKDTNTPVICKAERIHDASWLYTYIHVCMYACTKTIRKRTRTAPVICKAERIHDASRLPQEFNCFYLHTVEFLYAFPIYICVYVNVWIRCIYVWYTPSPVYRIVALLILMHTCEQIYASVAYLPTRNSMCLLHVFVTCVHYMCSSQRNLAFASCVLQNRNTLICRCHEQNLMHVLGTNLVIMPMHISWIDTSFFFFTNRLLCMCWSADTCIPDTCTYTHMHIHSDTCTPVEQVDACILYPIRWIYVLIRAHSVGQNLQRSCMRWKFLVQKRHLWNVLAWSESTGPLQPECISVCVVQTMLANVPGEYVHVGYCSA